MIRLERVSKMFGAGRDRKVVCDRVDAVFPTGESVALLGRNGAGKSTLLRLIGGSTAPDSGRIVIDGSVSWPVGFQGSFHPDLTGEQNTRFVARIYGVETQDLIDFALDFSELGRQFHRPVRHYSAGMKARLAFALSMGIRFDTYLIDEVTAVGDAGFRHKSDAVLRERLKTSGAIVVSHSMSMIQGLCTAGAVLEAGRLVWFDDISAAIRRHQANMSQPA